jgi:AraC-like DNA-binding protein
MMVKNRQTATGGIPELPFAPPVGTPSGFEALSLSQLRSRADQATLAVPRRRTFHQLLAVESGCVRQNIDFTGYALTSGMWSWVRPAQVQWWGDVRTADGALVLFEADFLDPATAAAARLDDPFAAAVFEPAPPDRRLLGDAVKQLERSFRGPLRLPLEVHQSVLRHLLAALVLRLAHLGPVATGQAAEQGVAFESFREAVERGFTRTRRLEDYAMELGYSARTLSRATQVAAGVNAKEFIDRRTILEARRMLAHSDRTAAQIAADLGFPSATNFSKYFLRRTGSAPIAFRAGIRSEAN